MDDSELEAILRRYAAADPPTPLRARVLGADSERPPWRWIAAAAALLLCTAALRLAAHADIEGQRHLAPLVAASPPIELRTAIDPDSAADLALAGAWTDAERADTADPQDTLGRALLMTTSPGATHEHP